MLAWRIHQNGEYGQWKLSGGTLAEKLVQQRAVRAFSDALRQARLDYYATEPHGQAERDLMARKIKVHRRRGYEIHELLTGEE